MLIVNINPTCSMRRTLLFQEYLDHLDAHLISEDLHWFGDFIVESHCCFVADETKLVDPRNHADAMSRLDADAWIEAGKKEIHQLIDRGCFKIVDVTVRKCQLCIRGDCSEMMLKISSIRLTLQFLIVARIVCVSSFYGFVCSSY